jgi:hypothetical protein
MLYYVYLYSDPENDDRQHTTCVPGLELCHLIESLPDVLDFPDGLL